MGKRYCTCVRQVCVDVIAGCGTQCCCTGWGLSRSINGDGRRGRVITAIGDCHGIYSSCSINSKCPRKSTSSSCCNQRSVNISATITVHGYAQDSTFPQRCIIDLKRWQGISSVIDDLETGVQSIVKRLHSKCKHQQQRRTNHESTNSN